MSEKRYYLKSVCGDEGVYDKENGCIIVNKNSLLDLDKNWNTIVDLLNELHDENQLLKCALALDAITNISLNDKKVDIPPYYEFENYQQLKKERREEYDEYW